MKSCIISISGALLPTLLHWLLRRGVVEDSIESVMTSEDESPSSRQDLGGLRGGWNYETIASTPLVADAFRSFAKRALCLESVCFLEEVSR